MERIPVQKKVALATWKPKPAVGANRYSVKWNGKTANTLDSYERLNTAEITSKAKTIAPQQIATAIKKEMKAKGYDVTVSDVKVTDVSVTYEKVVEMPEIRRSPALVTYKHKMTIKATMTLTSSQPLHKSGSPVFFIPVIVWMIVAVGVSVGLAIAIAKFTDWLQSMTTSTTEVTLTATDPATGKTTTQTTKSTSGMFTTAHTTTKIDPKTGLLTTETYTEPSPIGGLNVGVIALVGALGVGAYVLLKRRKREE